MTEMEDGQDEAAAASDRPRTALVITNGRSRRGQEAEQHVAALEEGGITVERRDGPKPGQVRDLILEMRDHVDMVVAAGGDGTMRLTALGLRETGLPLGILPMGTGNDLARTLSIPLDPAAAVGVILDGHTRAIDLGFVNGEPFFNVASVGLTTEITQKLSGAVKKRWGRLAYPLTALKVVLNSQRFSAIIRCGATAHRVRTMQITVGNGRFYGGGMVVHRDATIVDHMLDVYSLEPESKWKLLFMARAFSAGEHGDMEEVRTERSRVVEVVTKHSRPVSADGEIVTVTPARFSVEPDAVSVFVPGIEAIS